MAARHLLGALALAESLLRLGEHGGELRITLRLEIHTSSAPVSPKRERAYLEITEVAEQVRLSEQVREPLDRIGRLERCLLGPLRRKLYR